MARADTTIEVRMQLAEYVEVLEVGMKRANKLLAQGFKLVACDFFAYEANRRDVAPGGGKTFIKHDVKYVIGRTELDAPFPSLAELDAEQEPVGATA